MSEETVLVSQADAELDRLLGWVRAAESRLALVLPLSTAMIGALAVLMPSAPNWTVPGGSASAFAAFFLFLSIVFAACASFPRTTGPKGSLIYFGGIVSRDLSQYVEAVKSATQQTYLDDMLTQCHRNAQIAERKYTWIQRSMACLFLAALPWGFALFILYSGTP
ncbi:Pycsar system effector family protein [Desulfotignum phosphitoxidans]|uniref:Pycsar effector protein domain-containing protein n=1 Tax=Desulfotignum phosphitoxidans DSM 13687 TaxID=1286635 RepID=S0G662_9BACT|nr:Pycsar system effector family protein [Desulfotignum phosphitoxidans]EMS79881.1 hypothetical protein Dpo_3c00230 [Desulfotignum phosphitoxidans DSM 13687]